MYKSRGLVEGCGREGPLQSIFLCEFHHIAGPKITCQVPDNYVTKDEFESVSMYIIPKTELFHNIMTITARSHKIVGFPTRIENRRYKRNAYCFNLCFVFDPWARSVHYESVLKKLTDHLKSMEQQTGFLYQQAYSLEQKTRLSSMLTQVIKDLNSQKLCTLSEGLSVLHLKVIDLKPDPPTVLEYEVPVFLNSIETTLNSDQWDLTTNQVLPYINGVNHVAKIAAMADVDINLVKSCLQNLAYYGIVGIVPIFQYSNMYAITPKLRILTTDKKIQEECIAAVSRTEKHEAELRDVFMIYSNMRHGITLKQLCMKFNPFKLHIDERNLVQYGILEGFIRRIYSYPVFLDNCYNTGIAYSQYFNGEYCMDEICCITGLSIQQLEQQIDAYSNVTVIYR